MKSTIHLLACGFAGACILVPGSGFADTITWTGAGDGVSLFATNNAFGDRIQGTLDNADLTMSWGINLAGPMHLTNDSTFEATWFYRGSATISSLNGASTMIIREDGAGTYGSNTVDFLDFDPKIVYTNMGRKIEEVTNEHLSSFTVSGTPAVAGTNISIFTDGETGFTTVQAFKLEITSVEHSGSAFELNWIAMGLPAGVDVYRSSTLDGGWAQVGPLGIVTGTYTILHYLDRKCFASQSRLGVTL